MSRTMYWNYLKQLRRAVDEPEIRYENEFEDLDIEEMKDLISEFDRSSRYFTTYEIPNPDEVPEDITPMDYLRRRTGEPFFIDGNEYRSYVIPSPYEVERLFESMDPSDDYNMSIIYSNLGEIQLDFSIGNWTKIYDFIFRLGFILNSDRFIRNSSDTIMSLADPEDYDFDKIYISTLERIETEDTEPEDLAEGKTNCFVEILKPKLSTRAYNQYKDKKYVNQEDMKDLAKKAKCNVIFFDILNQQWQRIGTNKKYKTYKVLAHNNHAEEIKNKPVRIVKYVKSLIDTFNEIDNCYATKIGDNIISLNNEEYEYYQQDKVFISQSDMNDNYGSTKTILSRLLEQTKGNFVATKYLPKDVSEFIKAATHYRHHYGFKKDYTESYLTDQIRAYAQYDKCKYYEKYQFPNLPNVFIATNDKSYLKYTGFSQVNNVILHNDYLKATNYIQNNAVYSNVLLKYILKNEFASFDLVATAFNPKNQHINFKPEFVAGHWIPDDKLKQIQNALLGRLVPSSITMSKVIKCKDKNEFKHLKYMVGSQVIKSYKKEQNRYIRYKIHSDPKTYDHIHNYILDYQQINLLELATKIPINDIIAIQVDGIYTTVPINAPKRWHDCVKKNPSYVKVHIPTHKKYTKTPDYQFYDNTTFNPITYVYDIGGKGKSHGAANNPMFDTAVCCPTNQLMNAFKEKYPLVDCYTYESFFAIGTSYDSKHYNKYSTVVMDEVGMKCKKQLNTYLKILAKSPRQPRIHLIAGKGQLPPIKGEKIDIKRYGKQIKLGDKIYRTSSREYERRQQQLARLMDKSVNIDDIINIFKDRIIDRSEVKRLYDPKTLDVVICSTNAEVNYYNRHLKDDTVVIQWLINRKRGNIKKGSRVSINKNLLADEPKANYRICYSSTVHKFQGSETDGKVFISRERIWMPELLFVALTRNKVLENIYII